MEADHASSSMLTVVPCQRFAHYRHLPRAPAQLILLYQYKESAVEIMTIRWQIKPLSQDFNSLSAALNVGMS